MSLLKSESLVWLDQLDALRALPNDAGRDELKKALKLGDTKITGLQNLDGCLDPSAIEKIRQAAAPQPTGSAHGNPPQILSFKRAVALASLNGKIDKADLHATFHAALDVTLARRLPTKDIKKLVISVAGGKPASEFDPNNKTALSPPRHKDTKEVKTEKGMGEDQTDNQPYSKNEALDLNKWGQLLDKAKVERVKGTETTAQKNFENYILKTAAALTEKTSKSASSSEDGLFEMIFQDWLADIPVIQQIKSKIKKKKPITRGEKALLLLHKAGELAGRGIKGFFKLFKPIFRLVHKIGKLLKEALEVLGLYKYAKSVFTLVAFVTAVWFIFEALRFGVMRPVETVWSKIHFHHEETAASEPTAVPTTPPLAGISFPFHKSSTKVTRTQQSAAPKVVYEPAVSFIPSPSSTKTLYDPKILALEIAAIQQNSVIRDYVYQPDEGMPLDLAVSRLQDLTDPDKYTMMIGNSKQKILSVTPSNTNFIITYKSTDPFGVFGNSSGTMNIFLEDVLYIHINEIDHFSKPGAQADIQYQCTVVAKGAKYPLTIQCASSDDLENLVSTLEYFIRHSRLGHDAQPAGMPYTDQGIRFNDDRVVTLLWAKSPMDRASVSLGDHLWSAGKAAADQESKKDLEADLKSLPTTLFVSSPEDWNKAMTVFRQPGSANAFRPKLRKVVLQP